jgi:iron(III) transport system substrate-binding protein
MITTRRTALATVFAAALLAAWPAKADPLTDLAKIAATKGPISWYESSPQDQIDKVVAAFQARFPGVTVRHTRLVGGNELAVRSVQEMQARGFTGDVLTGGADHIWQIAERGYLETPDWSALGLPKAMSPAPFTAVTASSIYVLIWNDRKVQAAEVPKTWDDIVNAKWVNRSGSWVRAAVFAQLGAGWGAEKAKAELEKYVKLKPLLFKSTFPLAQAVGAGEVDVAIGFFHSTQPTILAGAPVKLSTLDPVPMHTIYSGVTKGARNPEGARLLIAWLATREGALAYEAATHRGNPLVPDTKSAQLLQGKTVVEWAPDKSNELGKLNEELNRILETVGAAR